jgi:hypothetical protein
VGAAASQGAEGCKKRVNNKVEELIIILKSHTKLETSNLTEEVLHRYHYDSDWVSIRREIVWIYSDFPQLRNPQGQCNLKSTSSKLNNMK